MRHIIIRVANDLQSWELLPLALAAASRYAGGMRYPDGRRADGGGACLGVAAAVNRPGPARSSPGVRGAQTLGRVKD
jgi:hypothetical protein